MYHAAALIFDLPVCVQSHVLSVRIIVDVIVTGADKFGVNLRVNPGLGFDMYAGQGLGRCDQCGALMGRRLPTAMARGVPLEEDPVRVRTVAWKNKRHYRRPTNADWGINCDLEKALVL